MKQFSDLNIKLTKRFVGDRIKIEKVEGDEITIHDFEVRESKIDKKNDPEWNGEKGECLYLQLEVNDTMRVLWGSYKYLIDQVKQINKNDLPFKAKIINEHGYVFK